MFYTIYKITHNTSKTIYIGMHKTDNLNDGYMGSGIHLKRAVEKYGLDQFSKEILYTFNNEEEMISKEIELVTEEFCKQNNNYNICPGGKGGWGYVNSVDIENRILKNQKAMRNANISMWKSDKRRKQGSDHFKKLRSEGKLHKGDTFGMKGKSHSQESREKMSLSQSGSKNSQFGLHWITDGVKSKRIKKTDPLPDGWRKGRI
jgi:hypothetical protein